MSAHRRRSLQRIFSSLLVVLASVGLYAPGNASAVPYVLTIQEQGADVVATGSGSFDLAGLRCCAYVSTGYGMDPSLGFIETGSMARPYLKIHFGAVGPTSLGNSYGFVDSTTGAGDDVMLLGYEGAIGLPDDYVSGDFLWSSSTWENASFATLHLTPGVYTWTWGSVDIMSDFQALTSESGACQSFTMIVGNVHADGVSESCGDNGGGVVSVPEPPAIGTFGAGTLLVGGMVALRRRRYQRVC